MDQPNYEKLYKTYRRKHCELLNKIEDILNQVEGSMPVTATDGIQMIKRVHDEYTIEDSGKA